MVQGLGLEEVTANQQADAEPAFLVKLEPWPRVFFRNLRDLALPRRQPPLRLLSWPAAPWPDIFVSSRLPWRGFVESVLFHVAAFCAVWIAAQLWPRRPQIVERPVFHQEDVIYYSAAEYLAPLDTGGAHIYLPQPGEPEYSPQAIISVPAEADNRTQTIVTPPDIKLEHEVPVPNIVAWREAHPAPPLASAERSAAEMKVPALSVGAVAPPPNVTKTSVQASPGLAETVVAPPPAVAASWRALDGPQTAVIAPPPVVESAASIRRIGDINIGHSDVVAPAPELPMGEQRASGRAVSLGGGSEVVPPPPSVQHGDGNAGGGRIIALNVRPVAPQGGEIPAGNRRGTFAATPEGKPGAAGTPKIDERGPTGQKPASGGNGDGSSRVNDAPQGLYVGAAPKAANSGPASSGAAGPGDGSAPGSSSETPKTMASLKPPRVSSLPPRPATTISGSTASDVERRVFGERKIYSMTLNMPNFNSAGGSWVIRFAELNENGGKGDLTAPAATQKVDPAYPMELMRQNVQGTVTLAAVIRSDGSVGDVRVLRGVDDRLDEYARVALARCRFRPATKNGTPVDLDAVVMIPFKPGRLRPGF
jgi:TonB family protein